MDRVDPGAVRILRASHNGNREGQRGLSNHRILSLIIVQGFGIEKYLAHEAARLPQGPAGGTCQILNEHRPEEGEPQRRKFQAGAAAATTPCGEVGTAPVPVSVPSSSRRLHASKRRRGEDGDSRRRRRCCFFSRRVRRMDEDQRGLDGGGGLDDNGDDPTPRGMERDAGPDSGADVALGELRPLSLSPIMVHQLILA